MPHGHSDHQLIIVSNFYRAFASNDAELLQDVCSSDWQDIPLAQGQISGPEGLLPIISRIQASLEDLKLSVKETISTPGRLSARVEMSGKHVGSLFGEEVSQKQVTIAIHEFHTIQNGKITKTYHMEDWLSFFYQVGSFPHLK